jgi:hypothetical protein
VKSQDEASLRLLEDLRRQLDELEQFRQEDLLKEDMENMVIDDEGEDEYNEEYVNEDTKGCKDNDAEESEGEAGRVHGHEDGFAGGDKDADMVGVEGKNARRQ